MTRRSHVRSLLRDRDLLAIGSVCHTVSRMTEHLYSSPELSLRIIQLRELERDVLAGVVPTERSFIVERVDAVRSDGAPIPA